MVVALMRRNLVQDVAGAFFGVSQPTVSRRWGLLRPVIADALDEFVPNPKDVIGVGSVLVDGTICPTWDRSAIPDLFSGKARYPGFNVQIAADLDGRLAAVGMQMVRGARHDAHAYAASGLADLLADINTSPIPATSGSTESISCPTKNPRGRELHQNQTAFNTALSGIRAAVERAVAHLKTWRMLSEEGGRYRAPIHKVPSALKTIVALHFFAETYEALRS
jgi:DDE superfamily endonuclease